MNLLYLFVRFDIIAFLLGKILTVTSLKTWKDYDSGKELGTAVTVAITQDETEYRPGEQGANMFEKFTIKVPVPITNVTVKIGDVVTPVNPVATVYGQYRNQLSVKADDIVKATQAAGEKK